MPGPAAFTDMISRRFALAGIAALTVLYGCSPVTVLNRLTPEDTYVFGADIAYGANPRQRLDVYEPAQRPSAASVVVFFYGGSWSSGDRGDYRFVGEALASEGIVTVIADYRLYPEVRYPAFLEDCAAALAWTFRNIAQYGGDTSRIFVAGHSAGAYNAAMLATDPRWLAPYHLAPSDLRGFIGLAGPYNFLPITSADIKPIFGAPDTPADSQPVAHVVPGLPPALLLVAKSDRFVYPDVNTEVLAAKLRAAGDDVEVREYADLSHTTLVGALSRPLRRLAPVLADTVHFIATH